MPTIPAYTCAFNDPQNGMVVYIHTHEYRYTPQKCQVSESNNTSLINIISLAKFSTLAIPSASLTAAIYNNQCNCIRPLPGNRSSFPCDNSTNEIPWPRHIQQAAPPAGFRNPLKRSVPVARLHRAHPRELHQHKYATRYHVSNILISSSGNLE